MDGKKKEKKKTKKRKGELNFKVEWKNNKFDFFIFLYCF